MKPERACAPDSKIQCIRKVSDRPVRRGKHSHQVRKTSWPPINKNHLKIVKDKRIPDAVRITNDNQSDKRQDGDLKVPPFRQISGLVLSRTGTSLGGFLSLRLRTSFLGFHNARSICRTHPGLTMDAYKHSICI